MKQKVIEWKIPECNAKQYYFVKFVFHKSWESQDQVIFHHGRSWLKQFEIHELDYRVVQTDELDIGSFHMSKIFSSHFLTTDPLLFHTYWTVYSLTHPCHQSTPLAEEEASGQSNQGAPWVILFPLLLLEKKLFTLQLPNWQNMLLWLPVGTLERLGVGNTAPGPSVNSEDFPIAEANELPFQFKVAQMNFCCLQLNES